MKVIIESFSALPAEKEFPSSVAAISFPFSPLEKVTSNCLIIFLNVTFTFTSEVILTLVTLSPALPPFLVSPPVIVHLSTS